MRVVLTTYGSRGDARASAPQVVIPQAADQPYWAARVADQGIGTARHTTVRLPPPIPCQPRPGRP